MHMVNGMSDLQPALDPDLARLFDEARTTLPAEAFLEPLERRMVRARRARLAFQVTALVVLAVAALGLAPYVVRGSDLLSRYGAYWVGSVGVAMTSPIGWGCSLMLGAWVLRRCHAFER
jgi:hypothetical protein